MIIMNVRNTTESAIDTFKDNGFKQVRIGDCISCEHGNENSGSIKGAECLE
jgi:hypothetical protein